MENKEINKSELAKEWRTAFEMEARAESEYNIAVEKAREAKIAIATRLRDTFGDTELTGPDGNIYVTRKVRGSSDTYQFAKKATRNATDHLSDS